MPPHTSHPHLLYIIDIDRHSYIIHICPRILRRRTLRIIYINLHCVCSCVHSTKTKKTFFLCTLHKNKKNGGKIIHGRVLSSKQKKYKKEINSKKKKYRVATDNARTHSFLDILRCQYLYFSTSKARKLN